MEQYAEDLIRAVSLAISFCAFFFGVPGNALVIHIIRTHPKFRTVHNIFHANLAIADLTTCGIGVPVFLATRYISPGDIRDYSCRFCAAITAAYNFMNICMLMSISIIRVHAVQRQKQSMSKKTAIVILVLFWILSILIFFVIVSKKDLDGIFVISCISGEDVPDLRGNIPYIFLFVFVPALVVLLLTCTCSCGYLNVKARRMRNFIQPITPWSGSVHFINTPHGPGAHYYRNTQYDLSRQHEMTNGVRNAPIAAHFISNMAMTSSILTAIYLLSTIPFLAMSVSQIWHTIPPSIVELCFVPSFCSMFLNPYIFASRNNSFKESFSRTIIQILQ